jgi:phospholipid/cholesterol/gamma-HCH transport system substrate-binding protein
MDALRKQLSTPLGVVVALILVGTVLVGWQLFRGDPTYHARLAQSGGLEPGSAVRVAGLRVGKVTDVRAEMDQVHVTFSLTEDPDRIGLTQDTKVEVKLQSLLGQRYLALTPGSASPLAEGGTIAIAHALDNYTMERFWLESIPQVQQLDLDVMERALDTLATDLRLDPEQLQATLRGVAGISEMVQTREEQFDELLSSTEQLAGLVLDQTANLDRVMVNGAAVMEMVHERRESLRQMLRAGHRFVTGLTALVEATAPQLAPLLRDLKEVLEVFEAHRADLDLTLELAGPTMRVFTNATGDGPWLGVNAPNAIFPDDLMCTLSLVAGDCR